MFEGIAGAISRGEFPHALLISGPQGVGKREMGFKIAKALLCQNPAACTHEKPCTSCDKVTESLHPDLKFFEAGDEDTLKVAEIREAIAWARFEPLEGTKKILIMESVERLNESALNAFLKLLEEPPRSTHIILLTSNPTSLKGTLLSRCFRLSLKPSSPKTIEAELTRRGTSAEEARYASLLSGGFLKRAEEILSEQGFAEAKRRLGMLLGRFSYEVAEDVFDKSSKFRDSEAKRKETERFLDIAEIFLRDVLVYQTAPQAADELLFLKGLKTWIEMKSSDETPRSLAERIERLEEIRRGLEFNTNPKLTLMAVAEAFGKPLLETANV